MRQIEGSVVSERASVLARQKAIKHERKVPITSQIVGLIKRDFIGLRRDKSWLATRLGLNVTMAILIGCIFWQAGRSDKSDVMVRLHHMNAKWFSYTV